MARTFGKRPRHNCDSCGRSLQDSVVAAQVESLDQQDSLLLLCSDCHNPLSEFEFVRFLADVLRRDPSYSQVRTEVVLQSGLRGARFQADIVVETMHGNCEGLLVIECKTARSLNSAPLSATIYQLHTYRTLLGKGRMILAVPATLSPHDLSIFESAGVEVWDLWQTI